LIQILHPFQAHGFPLLAYLVVGTG
jgi:hypothetical protein